MHQQRGQGTLARGALLYPEALLRYEALRVAASIHSPSEKAYLLGNPEGIRRTD
jgi:hypothetical protein